MKARQGCRVSEVNRSMMDNQNTRSKLALGIRWFIVIAMPFLLALVTLRLLITWNAPSYPAFEYDRIASDPFGFTDEQRLEYAEATLNFLRRGEPSEEVRHLLEDLRLPDGQGSFYNEREISHLVDVKDVADTFNLISLVLGALVLLGLVFLMWRPDTRLEAYTGLMYGGIFTAAILFLIVVAIFVSWNTVFVQFHELLFPPDTWSFAYSDSLIRLFPEQFWFDFGVIWAGGILLEGAVLALAGYLLRRRAQAADLSI